MNGSPNGAKGSQKGAKRKPKGAKGRQRDKASEENPHELGEESAEESAEGSMQRENTRPSNTPWAPSGPERIYWALGPPGLRDKWLLPGRGGPAPIMTILPALGAAFRFQFVPSKFDIPQSVNRASKCS